MVRRERKEKENGAVTRKGCERDPGFSLARGWGRPFSRVLNIFMMAAGALAEPLENGEWVAGAEMGDEAGGGGGWIGMGWGGWMEEGGQAERSTRGGLRGPRGPRGEKLEKGRFKYQPPRGGPRVHYLYLASFFLSRTDAPPVRTFSLLSPPALPPSYHPSPFFAYAHTHTTRRESLRTERYVHRQTLTHTSIDPRPEKRRLRAVRRWRTPVRQCYVLIGRPLPTLLFFADQRTFLI